MDFGEQVTGTRDDHYNLISVLYHALQGAENCNMYALDAEAAGDAEGTAFFREAGLVQVRLAERAKQMIGIIEAPPEPGVRPEGAVPSGGAPLGGGAPGGAGMAPVGDVPPETEVVVEADVAETGPTTGAAGTPPDAGLGGAATPTTGGTRTPPETPPGTALPGGEVEPPLSGTGAAPDADPEMLEEEGRLVDDARAATEEADRPDPGELDPTISLLEGGVAQADLSRAVAEIEAWERRLEATGDPELEAIVGNLGALRGLLSDEATGDDAGAVGPLLVTLGEQVRGVASDGPAVAFAEKLQRLAGLLGNEGRSFSGR